MVTSDFTPEVKIWPFRPCVMKNTQYNRYYTNSPVIVDLVMGQIPPSTERISSSRMPMFSTKFSVWECDIFRMGKLQ